MLATVFVFWMMFIGVMGLWWPWEQTDHLGVMWHTRPGSLCHQQLVSPAPIHFINSFMVAFFPLLNIAEHQWHTAEAAIISATVRLEYGHLYYNYVTTLQWRWKFLVTVTEGAKRIWVWSTHSCCPFFPWSTCLFTVCLASPTTLLLWGLKQLYFLMSVYLCCLRRQDIMIFPNQEAF